MNNHELWASNDMAASVDAEDKELILRCKKGDIEAFRGLFEKYQGRNYAVAYGIIRNREDALEVSQEAFIKAYRSIKSFRGRSSFGTWLFRITTNKAIDFLRRNKKHKNLEIKDLNSIASNEITEHKLLDHRRDPGETLADKELGKEIERALDKLPPKQRAVIILREVEGLSYEEISKTLGCPRGTVMSRLHGARIKLRELLQGHLEDGDEVL